MHHLPRGRVVALSAVLALQALGGLVGPAPRPAAAATGPVAHWTFDDGSGTTAADSSGNGDAGTLEGDPTWITSGAKVGSGALSFDGVDDAVVIPTSSTLEPASITVALWIRGDAPAQPTSFAVLQKGANACEAGSYGFQEFHGTGELGDLHARIETAQVGNYAVYYTNTARLFDGAWHHIVYTYDAGSNASGIYLDRQGTTQTGTPLLYGLPTASDLVIGAAPTTCSDLGHFQGAIDDVRIYDRALSRAEIDAFVPDQATTTTIDVGAQPVVWGSTHQVTATVSPAPTEPGTVRFYDVTDGHHDLVATSATDPIDGVAPWNIDYLYGFAGAGHHVLAAEFQGSGAYQPSASGTKNFDIDRRPVTVTVVAVPPSPQLGQQTTLTATVGPFSYGPVTFRDTPQGGAPVNLGDANLVWNGQTYTASIAISTLALGSHAITASVPESDTTAGATSTPLAMDVGKVPVQVLIAPVGDSETKHPWSVIGELRNVPDQSHPIADATGTMSLSIDGVLFGTQPVVQGDVFFQVPGFTAGSHTLTMAYSGDATYALGDSQTTIFITADVVAAAGVSLNLTTFYPYKDGYRDTVAIRGTRYEAASVAIRVYGPTNHLVRSLSIPLGSGAYSASWNGKSDAGKAQPAGRYKVVQTLTDTTGTHLVVTNYVTLSLKRLYYTTVTITKTIKQATKRTSSWAGWRITLPSATVYRSAVLSLYGQCGLIPCGAFGAANFDACPYSATSYGCVTKSVGIGGLGWASDKLTPSRNIHGRIVIVTAWANQGGSVYVGKIKLQVTYGVLR